MTIENIAGTVAQAYDGALAAYRNAQGRDRLEQARTTNGEMFAYERIENAIETQRETAMNAINAALASRENDLAAAPSAEAANYLTAISGRDDMSADEVNAALNLYGDTHAARKAILGAAKRSGVSITDATTETERDITALRELAATVEQEFSPLKFRNMSECASWLVKADIMGERGNAARTNEQETKQ